MEEKQGCILYYVSYLLDMLTFATYVSFESYSTVLLLHFWFWRELQGKEKKRIHCPNC